MKIEEFDIAGSLESELEAMWRFGYRLTANADDASELVQRTCVKALENSNSFTPGGKFRSWLFKIQHRIWLNEIRARKVRAHDYFDTTSATVQSKSGQIYGIQGVSDDAHSKVYLEQVYKAIEELPESQRLVLVLVNVEGCTYRETAEILDVPIGTVMSRLARARINIGKLCLDAKSTRLGSSGIDEPRYVV